MLTQSHWDGLWRREQRGEEAPGTYARLRAEAGLAGPPPPETAPDVAGLGAAMGMLLELMKDPKKATELAEKAKAASKTIAESQKRELALAEKQRKADADDVARRAEIDRLGAAHDQRVLAENAAIAEKHKAADADRAAAQKELVAAKVLKAEAARRLAAVERAVSGQAA